VKKICRTIKEHSGQEFKPELVDLFLNLAQKEFFWLDALSDSVGTILAERSAKSANTILNLENLEGVAGLFSRIIDFRSRYTSVHSAGVAAIAEYLARASGLPENTCRQIRIAGYLHDLGKLSVPKEILEKPSRLNANDFSIMKAHTFYTYRILERIKGFENICAWASFHHERADGSGYPFHVKGRKYSRCCRIMSVADIFTALTEDRPYRKGMSIEQALNVLAEMAENGKLDGRVLAKVRDNQKELMTLRNAAQSKALKEYERLERRLLLHRSEA
jgi:HD-GYP domain-containing protein (c-di-GMP phosphodiesterase class II)